MASCHALAAVRRMGGKSLAMRKREPAIELRNHLFRVPALLPEGFGNMWRSVLASCVAARRSRQTPCERGHSVHENRESPDWLPPMLRDGWGRPVAERPACTPPGSQTSDIVPLILPNKACRRAAETG
jgi:phage terminase small subunit